MALDLNKPPPDHALPDLNDDLVDATNLFLLHAQQDDCVGAQIAARQETISPVYGNQHQTDGGQAIPDLNKIPDAADDHQPGHVTSHASCVQQAFDLNFHAPEQNEELQLANNAYSLSMEEELYECGQATLDGSCVQQAFDLNLHASEENEEQQLANNGCILSMEEALYESGVYTDEVDIVFDQEELDDTSNEEDGYNNGFVRRRSKDLTRDQRQQIYEALLERSDRGKLKRDTTKEVAALFNVNRHAVWRIWRRAKQCRANGLPVDISSRKPKNCGRKKVELEQSQVESIPLHRRCTIRALAAALGMKKSTVHRLFRDGHLRRHSSSLKPYLKEANKKERLRWCISMLDHHTLQTELKFRVMDDIIHLDEKWFNATRKDVTYYMTPDEEDPHRTVRNKNYIDKVMFLSAVANPQYDDEGNCTFDGKIGIWPFITQEPAKKRSDNRPRGTLVHKTMKVDRNIIRSYLIAKVLPAIKARWPREQRHKTIWIQQDNARTHVPVNDKDFALAVAQTGLDIRLINQPPNSPDMNVLDLGFFASLQSFIYTTVSNNMDDLIANVYNEFEKYNDKSLRNVFLTLQGCMIEVMKAGGGNKYKIPHINKDRLEALRILPKSLTCDRELYESVMESLDA